MELKKSLENQGNFLFKHRSHLPLILIPAVLLMLGRSARIENVFGHSVQFAWESVCVLISAAGLGVRIGTVGYVPRGTSGRNVGGQLAEQLNTTGMYSICRHPLYLGNYLILLGFLLFTQIPLLAVAGSITFWLYYERIMLAEEAFLKNTYKDDFERWADATPTFFPSFKLWRSPALPFSLKTALRRELSTFLELIVVFPLLDIAADRILEGRWELDLFWRVSTAFGLTVFFTLFYMKKKGILSVRGR